MVPMGSEENWYRNFLWWQTGVSSDDAADVGGKMIRAVILWFAVLVALALVALTMGIIWLLPRFTTAVPAPLAGIGKFLRAIVDTPNRRLRTQSL